MRGSDTSISVLLYAGVGGNAGMNAVGTGCPWLFGMLLTSPHKGALPRHDFKAFTFGLALNL